jgi:chromosome segregation ATPase
LTKELSAAANKQAQTSSQLDARLADIDALRNSLSRKERDLTKSEAQRHSLLRDVGDLRDDLQRVRQDALSLGQDLADVRRREEEAERQQRKDQARADILQDELARVKNQLARVRAQNEGRDPSRYVPYQPHKKRICARQAESGGITAASLICCHGILKKLKVSWP